MNAKVKPVIMRPADGFAADRDAPHTARSASEAHDVLPGLTLCLRRPLRGASGQLIDDGAVDMKKI